jgi:hypothetical protein
VLALFLLMAIISFIAFAFLFYNTTMYSLEDNRKLFVRVYLTMLMILALGTYSLSAKANVPKNLVSNELTKENNHV